MQHSEAKARIKHLLRLLINSKIPRETLLAIFEESINEVKEEKIK